MKIRNRVKQEKIEAQMAPMIDVVFQLLIFFMLTLKIVEPEGDFNINMPLSQGAPTETTDINLPDIKVKLQADPETGRLAMMMFGSTKLGNDDAAFARLNSEILRVIGRPGNPLTKDIEVEIDADYNLHYGYVIKAVSACTGRLDPKSEKIVRYIEKIKFAKPKPPG
jgi:biopolymer transport protein ExbD